MEADEVFENGHALATVLRQRMTSVKTWHEQTLAQFFKHLRHEFWSEQSEKIDLKKSAPAATIWATTSYDRLPAWMQGNKFLLQHYRPPLPSTFDCARSIFRVHTETGNIWSHMLACILFIFAAIDFFTSDHLWREKLAFAPFFIGVVACFALSTFYHTFNCHSPDVDHAMCTMDLVGIMMALLGAGLSIAFYQWWCASFWYYVYAFIYIGGGSVAIYLIARGNMTGVGYGMVRTIFFCIPACAAYLSLMHDIYLHGYGHCLERYPMGKVAMITATFGLSAVLYATKTPERFFPGKFDLWLHSHQLFHVLVVAGASLGYHTLYEFAGMRAEAGDGAC